MERLFWFIKKVVRGWGFFETAIVATIILAIPMIMTFLSVERYAFSESTPGLQEFIVIIAAYAYFLGAAMASKYGTQITVTIIDVTRASERTKQYIDILASVITVSICVVFTYVAIEYLQSLESEGSRLIYPMRWPFQVEAIAFPIGMTLLVVYELVTLVRKVKTLRAT